MMLYCEFIIGIQAHNKKVHAVIYLELHVGMCQLLYNNIAGYYTLQYIYVAIHFTTNNVVNMHS